MFCSLRCSFRCSQRPPLPYGRLCVPVPPLPAVGTGVQLADRAIQNFLVVGEFAIALVLPENAFVVWRECAEPWRMEEELILTICLPLNLDQNRSNRFHPVLSERRRLAKIRARDLPIS